MENNLQVAIEADDALASDHHALFSGWGVTKITGAANLRGKTAGKVVELCTWHYLAARMSHHLRLHSNPWLVIRVGGTRVTRQREAEQLVRINPEAAITTVWDFEVHIGALGLRLTCACPCLLPTCDTLRREVGRIEDTLLRYREQVRHVRRVITTLTAPYEGAGSPVARIPGPSSGIAEMQAIGRLRRARHTDTMVGIALEDIQAGQMIGFANSGTSPTDDYPLDASLRAIEEKKIAGLVSTATGIPAGEIEVCIRDLPSSFRLLPPKSEDDVTDPAVRRAITAARNYVRTAYFSAYGEHAATGRRTFQLTDAHAHGKASIAVKLPPRDAVREATMRDNEDAAIEAARSKQREVEGAAKSDEQKKAFADSIIQIVRRHLADFDVHCSAIPPLVVESYDTSRHSDKFNGVMRALGAIGLCARQFWREERADGNMIYVHLEKGEAWAWLVVPEVWAVDSRADAQHADAKAASPAQVSAAGLRAHQRQYAAHPLPAERLRQAVAVASAPLLTVWVGTSADFGRSDWARPLRADAQTTEEATALEKRFAARGVRVLDKWTTPPITALNRRPGLIYKVGDDTVLGGAVLYVVYMDESLFLSKPDGKSFYGRLDGAKTDMRTVCAGSAKDMLNRGWETLSSVEEGLTEKGKALKAALEATGLDNVAALHVNHKETKQRAVMFELRVPGEAGYWYAAYVEAGLTVDDGTRQAPDAGFVGGAEGDAPAAPLIPQKAVDLCLRYLKDFVGYLSEANIDAGGWTLFPHTSVKALTPEGDRFRAAIEAAGMELVKVGYAYHTQKEAEGTVWDLRVDGVPVYIIAYGSDLAACACPRPRETLLTDDEEILRDEGYPYDANARRRLDAAAIVQVEAALLGAPTQYVVIQGKPISRVEAVTPDELRELRALRDRFEAAIPQRFRGDVCRSQEPGAKSFFQFGIMTDDGRDLCLHLLRKD